MMASRQRSSRAALLLLGLALGSVQLTGAYYIPGTYPQEFKYGDSLEVHVNSLKSYDTDIPREYYSLPFCKPEEGVHRIESTVNPGTILLGLRIENSPYELSMMTEQRTKEVCTPQRHMTLSEEDATQLVARIDDKYRINMILDNMPVTTYDLDQPQVVRPGFEIGYVAGEKHYIFNHLVFNVLVHETFGQYARAQAASKEFANVYAASGTRKLQTAILPVNQKPKEADADNVLGGRMFMVVGFEVMPCSIKRDPKQAPESVTCNLPGEPGNPEPQEIYSGADIVYTYDVYWQLSSIKWASRWDAYLRTPGGRVHWFGLANSVLVVVVLAAVVAMILFRTVRMDLAKYEELLHDTSAAPDKEEAGWKMVGGDVFRAPAKPVRLAVFVGTGAQVVATTVATMVFAVLGFLSPASRGSLLTAALLGYFALAALGGSTAVCLLSAIRRGNERAPAKGAEEGSAPLPEAERPKGWKGTSVRVACTYPAFAASVLFALNIVISATRTTGAIPSSYLLGLVALWFAVSVPSTLLGGLFGASVRVAGCWPTRTNQIPRHVPPPANGFADRWALFAGAGLLPFGTLFIELYFTLSSIWQGYYYYLFGFLFVGGVLAIVIICEVALVTTYIQLCHEDYHWWWASFHRGGSVALYVGLYALGFLAFNLGSLHTLAVIMYFAYTLVLVVGMYLATGAISFGASLWLVKAMYGAVKAD